jgi:hypothetical protein
MQHAEHLGEMQHDASAQEKSRFRIRARVNRIVHGKPGRKIVLDVPCERCEKARCRRLGLRFPQPGWGSPEWVHPPRDDAFPAFTPRAAPVSDFLLRAVDKLSQRLLDASADPRVPLLPHGENDSPATVASPASSAASPSPNGSVHEYTGNYPVPRGSGQSGGSAPF